MTLAATLVIPCYNEAKRLPPFLAALLAELDEQRCEATVLVVDDGSRPQDREVVAATVAGLRRRYGDLRLAWLDKRPNQGKGAALAAGFGAARTPLVGFVDADGSVPPAECVRLLTLLRSRLAAGEALAGLIGCRIKLYGNPIDRKLSRHLSGRVFATLVSNLFDFPIYDSQCGLKLFVADIVSPLLPHIQSRTWLWDTQLLVLLHQRQARFEEVPIRWREIAGSKVSLIRDSLRMALGLMRFRRHLRHITLPTPTSS